jgi:hypothetical protein
MGSLLVASLLTLVFLPTLYVTWFKGFPPTTSEDTPFTPPLDVEPHDPG